jgi:uncharacterized protein (DUF433 family)
MDWHERVFSDPRVLRGKPCIEGARTPAALVPGYARDLSDFEAVTI